MTMFLNKQGSWHNYFDNFSLLLIQPKFRPTEQTSEIKCLTYIVNKFVLPKFLKMLEIVLEK